MQQILSVGGDPGLLYTRSLVLARWGASVRSATPIEAPALLDSGSFELLLLCHSIRYRDLDRLCRAAQKAKPRVRTLLIEGPTSANRPDAGIDSIFALEEGPERLLQVVAALSLQPGVASPGSAALLFCLPWSASGAARHGVAASARPPQPRLKYPASP